MKKLTKEQLNQLHEQVLNIGAKAIMADPKTDWSTSVGLAQLWETLHPAKAGPPGGETLPEKGETSPQDGNPLKSVAK